MTAARRSLPTPLSPRIKTVERDAAIFCASSRSSIDLGSTATQVGSGFDLAGSGCTARRSYFFLRAFTTLLFGAAFFLGTALRAVFRGGELFLAATAGRALPT